MMASRLNFGYNMPLELKSTPRPTLATQAYDEALSGPFSVRSLLQAFIPIGEKKPSPYMIGMQTQILSAMTMNDPEMERNRTVLNLKKPMRHRFY
jgi:hypothetical protein